MSKPSHFLQLGSYTASSTPNYQAWFNTQVVAAGKINQLEELFFADPILCLFCRYNYRLVVDSYKSRVINTFRPDLMPGSRNNILKGLTIISNVVRSIRKENLTETLPSWNMRRSLSSSGVVTGLGSSQVPLSDRLTNFVLPTGITSVLVPTVKASSPSGQVHHLSFDGLRVFAYRLLPFVGQQFRRNNTLGRYAIHVLTDLVIDKDLISYTINAPFHKGYPSGVSLSQLSNIRVKIRRISAGDLSSERTEIVLEGLNAYAANPPQVEPVPFSIADKGYYVSSFGPSSLREKETRRLEHCMSFDINQFSPALYHTQGRAMRYIMIDYDRNFENLVESTSFVSDLKVLAMSSEKKISIIFSNKIQNVGARISAFATLLSDATLAWSFGIKPTIDAIRNLVTPLVSPMTGEGEIRYQTDNLSSVPQSLRDVLFRYIGTYYGYQPSDCLYLDVRFRSQAWTYPSYIGFATALWETSPALAAGVIPTPSGIYNAGRMTFIVDWFTGVGTYIDDLQTYATSFTMPYRIGHSVRCEMYFSDGRCFDVFLRSAGVSQLFDPPDDSWLNLPALPPIALPLAVSLLWG